MRNFGRTSKTISTVFALASAVIGFVAISVVSKAAYPVAGVQIGDARVEVGHQTARAVEQVDYRDGVERIDDVVIDGGSPVALISDPDLALAWELVDSVWPSSLRDELKQISLIDEGPGGLVGVVHKSATGGWILSIDRADLGDRKLVQETVVHEIAHMVTLGPDDFTFNGGSKAFNRGSKDSGPDTGNCDGVSITAGCAQPESLMGRYAARFWPGGRADASPSDLVDDYASTAAHEDLAETFTAWVADWPISSSDVQSRIDMLAADPVIAALEAEIHSLLD